jgi:hypothetical protein
MSAGDRAAYVQLVGLVAQAPRDDGLAATLLGALDAAPADAVRGALATVCAEWAEKLRAIVSDGGDDVLVKLVRPGRSEETRANARWTLDAAVRAWARCTLAAGYAPCAVAAHAAQVHQHLLVAALCRSHGMLGVTPAHVAGALRARFPSRRFAVPGHRRAATLSTSLW